MVERRNIGIFGRVNVGKSLLMNTITQQGTSIVDKAAGTTADVKQALMEVHDLGPIKLFDTAGMDESGALGQKKLQKSCTTLKECDLVILMIDPARQLNLEVEKQIISLARSRNKHLLVIFNLFSAKFSSPEEVQPIVEGIIKSLHCRAKHLIVDLIDKKALPKVINFITKNASFLNRSTYLFPHLTSQDIVFLNIPMDEETPSGRLLRPQALVQETLIRRFVPTFAYRMDLAKARNADREERERFQRMLQLLGSSLSLLITDSQAIDIVHDWTLDERRTPIVNITTFSVIMAHLMSDGKLQEFVKGLEAFKKLKMGDKVLIAEACNHNRIAEDIGTVQIPRKITQLFGKNMIHIDHAFGRDLADYALKEYKLVIHCGGCMIDKQKIRARLDDLIAANVPITNYGVLLSYLRSPKALERVVQPFSTHCSPSSS